MLGNLGFVLSTGLADYDRALSFDDGVISVEKSCNRESLDGAGG